jgi:trans-aconitate methyltransferase
VLDVGCETGAVSRVLAGWPLIGAVVGLDPSPSFVAKARELDLTFTQGRRARASVRRRRL